VSGLSEPRLVKILRKVAFGGCAISNVQYSIVGHDHRDHIVADQDIIVVGPVRETVRRHNVLRVAPDHTSWIHLDKKTKLFLWVLGRKALSGFGINAKLHTFPVVLQAKDEFAIYIDDLDVEDIEHVKKLLTELKKTYGDALKVALLPAYGHTLQHGAKTPQGTTRKGYRIAKVRSRGAWTYRHSFSTPSNPFRRTVVRNTLPKELKNVSRQLI
jgi:hypothetical protein